MKTKDKVLVVSACRDEREYLSDAVGGILRQSVRPDRWIIVDDGSTDGSFELLTTLTAPHAFIKVIKRENRGHRSVGPGTIDSVYEGLADSDPSQYGFLCILDMDTVIPSGYLEILTARMSAEPRLGTCSGKPYSLEKGRLRAGICSDEYSAGQAKLFRMDCFREIGGVARKMMWDAIDCHACRLKGWKAGSFRDPELRFTMLRPEGASDGGILRGKARLGAGYHFMGTGVPYIFAASFRHFLEPPLQGGFAFLWGYFRACLKRTPRYENREVTDFTRKFQYTCLLMGKAAALRRTHAAFTKGPRGHA